MAGFVLPKLRSWSHRVSWPDEDSTCGLSSFFILSRQGSCLREYCYQYSNPRFWRSQVLKLSPRFWHSQVLKLSPRFWHSQVLIKKGLALLANPVCLLLIFLRTCLLYFIRPRLSFYLLLRVNPDFLELFYCFGNNIFFGLCAINYNRF